MLLGLVVNTDTSDLVVDMMMTSDLVLLLGLERELSHDVGVLRDSAEHGRAVRHHGVGEADGLHAAGRSV